MDKTRNRRDANHSVIIAMAGCASSSTVVIALHGSRWPTALFVIAGSFLPVLLRLLLSRIPGRHIRWPGVLSLITTTLAILIIAWLGKYPNAKTAFTDCLGRTPPANIRNISALCGWFDGRITIVRFNSDAATIRGLLPPGTKPQLLLQDLDPAAQAKEIDMRWSAATLPGWIIDRPLRDFPGWRSVWNAQWNGPSNVQGSVVKIIWDEPTGQAVVVSLQD